MKHGLNTDEGCWRAELRKSWRSGAAVSVETKVLHFHNLLIFGLLLFGFIATEVFKAPSVGAIGYANAALWCLVPLLVVIVDLVRRGWNRTGAGVLAFALVNLALTALVVYLRFR